MKLERQDQEANRIARQRWVETTVEQRQARIAAILLSGKFPLSGLVRQPFHRRTP